MTTPQSPTPLSQDAKAREMARELRECCRDSHREWIGRRMRLPNGHSCMDSSAADLLLSAHARMERMEKALRVLLEMCERANPGAFENGVRVEGSPDEGEVWAGRTIEAARAALGERGET